MLWDMHSPPAFDSDDSARTDLPTVSTSLLFRVQQMNPDAWERLVSIFSPIIYRWARTSGLPEDDAADVVQDVLGATFRNIGRFEKAKPSGSFRSWLATITRNRVRDFYRRQSNASCGAGGTDALLRLQKVPSPKDTDSLEDSISVESLNRQLPSQALEVVRAECEPRTWQAFWRTTVDQRRASDVAAELGMNLAAVYQAKSRVLRRLRKCLSDLP